MARKPGSLALFTCVECSSQQLVAGGNTRFLCANCKPASHITNSPKYIAHQAVARARRHGELADPKTLACADCGGAADRYDHRDYSFPLAVDPVCRCCNAKRGSAVNRKAISFAEA